MEKYERYQRQFLLPHFGEEAQSKLKASRVLIVGLGGLGCPVIQQLASIGIGNIGIVDDDTIEISNLPRQQLYSENSVGCYKCDEVSKYINRMNSEIFVDCFPVRLIQKNIQKIFDNFDIIVDCTDNFATRYLINDACVIFNKILVYGSVFKYQGQVATFNYPLMEERSNQYRDLFAKVPLDGEVPTCGEAGVLGLLTNSIGNFMAMEVIKIILGMPEILYNKLLAFDLLSYQISIYEYKKNEEKKNYPTTKEALLSHLYEENCIIENSVSVEKIKDLLSKPSSILIDVREYGEMPAIAHFNHIQIPLNNLEQKSELMKDFENIIFVCKSGGRSKNAVDWMRKNNEGKNLFYFDGAIENLNIRNE